MSDGTKIEWTDATWNVVNGCSVVSPGCTNCYAMRLAGTRLRNHPSRAGLTADSKAGPVWTGEVRFNDKVLDDPLRWRRPRRIFVCAHGDLFHPNVSDEWIDKVFAVMSLARRHQFQVLTKRPDRMRAYVSSFKRTPLGFFTRNGEEPTSYGGKARDSIMNGDNWPLPNVWLGVSVEDQARADERIPHLLATPAAIRWVSAEPLLGPIDLSELPVEDRALLRWNALTGRQTCGPAIAVEGPRLDWVVAGGESGPGARPMHPDWARGLRNQCAEAGVAFHFKQHGSWAAFDATDLIARADAGQSQPERAIVFANPAERSGLQQDVWRVGKKAAGRHLDGQLHDGYPA